MEDLNPNTILQRIPALVLDIDSNNNIMIHSGQKVIHCGPHGLAILNMFYQPTSLKEALLKLQERIGRTPVGMDLINVISHLYKAGILRGESQNRPTWGTDIFGFDSAQVHIAMLNDKTRTLNYFNAIREVVHKGDIVVDIGTGLGILAMTAVRAGARQVYAVEASGIGKSAKAIFEANGVADRVTLIEGWSTQIDLPEQADVFISEIIGNEPLGERILEITIDATKRLLKPEGRLVPNKIKIFGLPVSIPNTELIKHTLITETLKNWQSWYGIDFNPLGEVIQKFPQAFSINSFLASDWETLSEPILLAEINLKDFDKFVIDNTATVNSNASGQLNGLLEYFELELSPTTSLSTHPAKVDINNHWRSPVWVFIPPLLLDNGDQFTVNYQYRKTGDSIKVSLSRL